MKRVQMWGFDYACFLILININKNLGFQNSEIFRLSDLFFLFCSESADTKKNLLPQNVMSEDIDTQSLLNDDEMSMVNLTKKDI